MRWWSWWLEEAAAEMRKLGDGAGLEGLEEWRRR